MGPLPNGLDRFINRGYYFTTWDHPPSSTGMIQPEVVSQKTKKKRCLPPRVLGSVKIHFFGGAILYAFIALDITNYICCWTPFLRHMKFANTVLAGLQPHTILEKQTHSKTVPLGRHLNCLCFSDKLIPPLAVDMFIPENQWELRKIPDWNIRGYTPEN